MRGLVWVASLALCLVPVAGQSGPGPSAAQPVPDLCALQLSIAQGQSREVTVSGVFVAGPEGEYLVSAACPGRSTAVLFKLTTQALSRRLYNLVNATNRREQVKGDGDPVEVTFEGEFFGPMQPDPRLPPKLRDNYHPGWDHFNRAMSKIEVHKILAVEPLPAGSPCVPPKSNPRSTPCLQ